MQKNKENILDFSNNINPLGMSKQVKKAIIENVDLCEKYPTNEYREVIEAIAEYENVLSDKIVIGNGSTNIIYRIVNLLRPKKALLVAPTASDYDKALDSVGCAVSYHRLLEQNNFTLDETILFQLTPNIDICFLCNPNNPTGQRAPKQLLLRIAKQCKENNIFLVIDEGFMDFVIQNELYSAKDLLIDYNNLIIIKALSKTYAMSGLRFGYGICYNDDFILNFKKSAQKYSVCVLACIATKVALSDKEYMSKSTELVRQEYEYLKHGLEKLGFIVFPSKANFLLFKSSQINIADKLKQQGILIRRCEDFKGLGNNYFRVGIKDRKSNEILLDALSNLV